MRNIRGYLTTVNRGVQELVILSSFTNTFIYSFLRNFKIFKNKLKPLRSFELTKSGEIVLCTKVSFGDTGTCWHRDIMEHTVFVPKYVASRRDSIEVFSAMDSGLRKTVL